MTQARWPKLLAPYIAVGIFWCGLSNAWLAILAYHGQILFWSRGGLRHDGRERIGRPVPRWLTFAIPAAMTGPALYFLLPIIARVDLGPWLESHHLSGLSLVVMIPYFGLVHPWLEQRHWASLRQGAPVAHPLFAGYHVLVLYSLLTVPWLVVCFVVLTAASVAWEKMATRYGGLALPVTTHMLADLGVVVVAWLRS